MYTSFVQVLLSERNCARPITSMEWIVARWMVYFECDLNYGFLKRLEKSIYHDPFPGLLLWDSLKHFEKLRRGSTVYTILKLIRETYWRSELFGWIRNQPSSLANQSGHSVLWVILLNFDWLLPSKLTVYLLFLFPCIPFKTNCDLPHLPTTVILPQTSRSVPINKLLDT